MDNPTKAVRSRKGIHHHEKNSEDNKQVERHCYICSGPILSNCYKIRKDETGYESSGIQWEEKYAKSDEQSENEYFICENCAKTNRQSSRKVKWKSIIQLKLLILIVVGLLFCLGLFVRYKSKNSDTEFAVNVFNQTQEEIAFDDELYGIGDTYTYQNERIWSTFAGGVKSVIAEKDNKPSVFLLLFDDDGAEKTAKCLAQDVAKVASKYLMKKKTELLIYGGAELNRELFLDDPGRMLVAFKGDVEKNGAMIVTNLQDVNPKIATSFHFFCDRFSPLVKKSIYLFTLKVRNLPKDSDKKLQEIAEEELNELWAEHLPENKLHPLITRLTGHVLKIVKDYSSC